LLDGVSVKTIGGFNWAIVHPHNQFLFSFVLPSRTTTSGIFTTNVVYPLPPSDIVNGPNRMEQNIMGDCQSKTYTIEGSFTLSNSIPNDDATGPENVYRRIIPGTPMEFIFGSICTPPPTPPKPPVEVQKLMDQEDALNDRCRDGSGDNPLNLKVCDVRDKILKDIQAHGWCWGHEGQAGYQKDWEPCPAMP
jgi:hypothetical protein